MKAIIGLGNPGNEYKYTRHNAGWHTIDYLSKALNATYWKTECGAEVAHCKNSRFDFEILLVKPQSYMNLSGGPVKNIMCKYNIPIDDLIIIHDDLDIAPGNIRIKKNGSSAGHIGLKSITSKLQSQDYLRIRIGIGKAPEKMPIANFVLEEPKGQSAQAFDDSCLLASEAILFLLENKLDQAQQKYNTKN